MKIGGMGEEALKVELHEIRKLGDLPEDVEIVRVLPPPNLHTRQQYSPEWIAGDMPFPPLYLHIRHRYCMRVPPGAPLCYDSIDNFLVRFHNTNVDEAGKWGLPVPEHLAGGVWVDDDA